MQAITYYSVVREFTSYDSWSPGSRDFAVEARFVKEETAELLASELRQVLPDEDDYEYNITYSVHEETIQIFDTVGEHEAHQD